MAVFFAGSMFAATYTVVGGSAAIFGETWKPENTANDMVADGNVFKFVKSDVQLSAGTIEYKIVEDHAWTKSYPQQGNASFNIAKDGKYDVSFTLDLSANPEYSVVAEFKEEVVIEHTASIKGGWDSWAAEVAFTLSDDKLTASAKKEFSADTYEFKAIIDGDSWRSNGGSITRAAASATLPDNNAANMKLVADVDGEYVFTWTFATNTLVVTFPEGGGSVDPEPTAKFYITGDSALIVDAGLTVDKAWNPGAIKSEEDSYILHLKTNQDYVLKVTLNGTWEGENNVKGYNELSEKTEGLKDISNDHNIGFRLNESGDVKVIYTAEVFKLEGDFYVAPALNLEDGYYLIGLDAAEWNVENIKPEHLFSVNSEEEAEYMLNVTLAENQEFKVVSVQNDVIMDWYPNGYDNNYIVGANYAGEKTVYFRPDGNGGDGWHYGVIYVPANEEQPAEPENLWKVTEETAVEANSVYIDNDLLELKSTYAGTRKDYQFMYGDLAFTNTIQVRTDGYPTAEYLAGKEKSGSTSLILTAKEDIAITLYFRHQSSDTKKEGEEIVSVTHELNDNKDLIVFDQEAISEKMDGEFTVVADGEKEYALVTKRVVLVKDHIYTLTASGTTLQLSGMAYESLAAPADPTVVVYGTMTEPAWEVGVPFELAEDKQSASLTVEHIGAGEYNFKFMINGEWRSNGYRYHRGFPGTAGINENNEADMVFVADQDGEYTFQWFFANDSLAIIYPEKQEPVYNLENGYYLIGLDMADWTVEYLTADRLLSVNPENEKEYMINITLVEKQELKVVYVENDVIKTWYPDGYDNNYVVNAEHAGDMTVYFRPDGEGGEGWHYGVIYVAPNSASGFEQIVAAGKAAKIVRNGQMLIIKGDKTFNAQGAIVK